ncbi:hypothetical protein ND748_20980 [Frankia sp. AiPs1]|uniref:hypothetical protein n=1 Tax=Frankia sp. AiPs1 TaxID=573493 RepID=UPI00204306AE|nr:hypothetical protein [Frankia sp. AiPs1]MCM3924132.1 hypothetical protein [Frankia sp. AiPs1]
MPDEPAERRTDPAAEHAAPAAWPPASGAGAKPNADPSSTTGPSSSAEPSLSADRFPSAEAGPRAAAGPDSEATPDAGGTGEEPTGSTFASKYPLRPVDWDGSFSRTWGSRLSEEMANERAAEQERAWQSEHLRKLRQESLERMDAESERQEAQLPAERRRQQSASAGGQSARAAAARELQRKLDKLDRFSGDAPGGSAGSADSAGAAEPDWPAGPEEPVDPR